MTDREIQETKDTLLLDWVKRKMDLDLAKERVSQTVEQIEAVAKSLRKGIDSNFEFYPRTWLNSDALLEIVRDVEKAREQFSIVHQSAIRIGVALPYSQ